MNVEQLYRDFRVQYATDGHKHTRPGWVNTECPFCTGNAGLHLGYDTELDRFVCWRCGAKSPVSVISALLHVSIGRAFEILKVYGIMVPEKRAKTVKQKQSFKTPTELVNLTDNHKKYLNKRGFDSDEIEALWNIQSTSLGSKLHMNDSKVIDYKHRIFIPYVWEWDIVSYDTRDVTGNHKNKYQACPFEFEKVPHKDILYGRQDKWVDTGICVEGPTDVWRMGVHSFATSGIKYTTKQMRVISKSFKRVGVMFDGDELQAKQQANKLVADLQFRGLDAFRVDIQGDPGDLSPQEAQYIVNQIIFCGKSYYFPK